MNLNETTNILECIGKHLETNWHNKPLTPKAKNDIIKEFGVSVVAFEKVFGHYSNVNRGSKYHKRREKK